MSADNYYSAPLGFSSLFAFCGLPIRLDAYKGCAFRCTYCFARAREGVEGNPKVRPADPQVLARALRRVFVERREKLSVVSKCLQRRMPIHLGGMGDPFQPAEQRYKVSLQYLRTAVQYQYPLVISTRGDLIADSPYIELLKELQAVVVRLSLSTTEDTRSSLVERSEVRPSKVLRTMEKLSSIGVRVACRWQPFIPGISEDPEIFAPRVAATGSRHCSFEFLRLPREQNPLLIEGFREANGENIYKFYKSLGALHRVREYILPPENRLPVILRARAAVRASGMSFGAADNDFQYLSDNACCCSGVDGFPGFDGFFRHQIAYAVRRNFGRRIEYESIAHEWSPGGSIDRYLNSGRRVAPRTGAEGTVRDHIAQRWNTLGLEGSPDSFFGVEPTGEFTADRMRVYRWNPEKLAKLKPDDICSVKNTA
jgi:DNA repair photolyase